MLTITMQDPEGRTIDTFTGSYDEVYDAAREFTARMITDGVSFTVRVVDADLRYCEQCDAKTVVAEAYVAMGRSKNRPRHEVCARCGVPYSAV